MKSYPNSMITSTISNYWCCNTEHAAEVSIIASTITLHILHISQAFLPISLNYWASTLLCEDVPAEALARLRVSTEQPGGISEIKRSSFNRKLCLCIHKWGKRGNWPKKQTMSFALLLGWISFRDQWGSEYQKQQMNLQAPKANPSFLMCIS